MRFLADALDLCSTSALIKNGFNKPKSIEIDASAIELYWNMEEFYAY
jgi:hypothetical protein